MAYKPKNVAKFRNKSTDYSPGTDGHTPAMVPGATGSDDRESQGRDVEFKDQGQVRRANPDFSIVDGGNDRLDPRKNENHGRASYAYQKPTL